MHARLRPLPAAMVLFSVAAMAGAQTQDGTKALPDQAPAPHGQPSPNAPAERPRQPPSSGSSTAPGSLSRELDRSGGVLQPPPTGDQSVVPPPNQGTSRTPVIPPPGTPGGNPQVEPK